MRRFSLSRPVDCTSSGGSTNVSNAFTSRSELLFGSRVVGAVESGAGTAPESFAVAVGTFVVGFGGPPGGGGGAATAVIPYAGVMRGATGRCAGRFGREIPFPPGSGGAVTGAMGRGSVGASVPSDAGRGRATAWIESPDSVDGAGGAVEEDAGFGS